ncbi:MAG: hypothetical protein AAF589_03370, partial [Planctomycetota bacterium]
PGREGLAMTVQHDAAEWKSPSSIAWLQPVRLPVHAMNHFARQLDEALADLEQRHGVVEAPAAEPAFASLKRHRRPR